MSTWIFVTATGFKPVTPTSVVWYSIQLSYAAVLFAFASAKIVHIFYPTKKILKKMSTLSTLELLSVKYQLFRRLILKQKNSKTIYAIVKSSCFLSKLARATLMVNSSPS